MKQLIKLDKFLVRPDVITIIWDSKDSEGKSHSYFQLNDGSSFKCYELTRDEIAQKIKDAKEE